ncbi:chloride channel protein, partial [Clostridioides difficile]|nr:chloride channel protein [Clostridioides difficile]
MIEKFKTLIWIKMIIRIKSVYKTYGGLFFLGLIGIPVGAIIGLIDTIFGTVLLKVTDIRETYPMYLIPFLAVVGVVIAYCYFKFGGKSSKGMNLIFEVGHGEEEIIPLRLVPFIISGTWLTHLFGGSAGREGVAVQIGATFSHWVGKRLPIKNACSIFLVTGMAAGFAGLFETPIAAILFAMEVLVAGSLEYQSLFPAFTASFTASSVSKALGLEKFSFALS